MKIVYNIAGTFNSGGMERVLAHKANYFVKLGHEVIIVTTDQKEREPFFEMDPRIVQMDLGINYLENTKRPLFQKMVGYFKNQRKHKAKLKNLLKDLKADIVISMFDHDAPFLYKIKEGSKKLLEIHFSRYKRLQYKRNGILGLIDRYRSKEDLKIAANYDQFVVLTKEDQSYWGNLKNITVIPNPNSMVPTSSADLRAKRVIAVGRLDYQKGFDHLIKAWKIVNQKQPDWQLSLFGEGPLKSELTQLIASLGLEKVIELHQPVKDIEKEYLASSMLTMTSRYEGLPMTLLEGQACGLPLVAYSCKCGPKDIIEEGKNGFLIEPGDISGFAEKLLLLISQTDLRLQMGGESLSRSLNFSEEKIMGDWMRLFTKLMLEPK